MVQRPIWSTWARYKVNINDSVVRSFAQQIVDHGFRDGQLEIDDFWEVSKGFGLRYAFSIDSASSGSNMESLVKQKR